MRNRWIVWIAIVAILVSGCVRAGSSAEPPAAPSSSLVAAEAAVSSVRPSPMPNLSSAPTIDPLPSGLDPKVAHAVEMRRGSGLRYDLEYVLASMTDPRARIYLLDFPMYPEEEAKLIADQADQDVAVSVIQAYAAAHAGEYGGVYIDRDEHPGIVTALWTDHLGEHQRAINDKLDGRFVILRQVRWSEAYLTGIQERVAADLDWLAEIPAAFDGVGAHTSANAVFLEVSSAEPRAVELILAHYGLGEELVVTSDGTGARLIPGGTVKGRVVRPDGKRLGENDLLLGDESTTPGGCGGGDMGFGIRHDGTFEYPCQAGVRTILVQKNIADGEWKVIGRGTVTVVGHKTVKLTIKLTENP